MSNKPKPASGGSSGGGQGNPHGGGSPDGVPPIAPGGPSSPPRK